MSKILTEKSIDELIDSKGTVIIPEGFGEIGASAFYGADIVRVKCPDGLERIGELAFYG